MNASTETCLIFREATIFTQESMLLVKTVLDEAYWLNIPRELLVITADIACGNVNDW